MVMQKNEDTPMGLAFASSAYLLWGFLPSYMKLLAHLGPLEIVAHRIIWALPVAATVLLFLGRTRDLWAALRSTRMLGMGLVTAVLVSANWSIYIWAVTNDRAMDAALGYYINPLFSIALGALLLGERLTSLQLIAVALASAAVALLTWQAGALPLPALGMMVTWGLYALAKKQLPIGPNQGFVLEVLILLPFALGYLAWLGPQNAFPDSPWILIGCGVVTAAPLMLYANGAKGLRLSTIGILQYIAPTMILAQAIFLFGEPFEPYKIFAFSMIWAALAIYTWSMLQAMRKPN